jgi:hypothetical protein
MAIVAAAIAAGVIFIDTPLLDLQKSASWYDFSVRVTGHDAYVRRYAGHDLGRPQENGILCTLVRREIGKE